jgi:hypothetical protein
MEEDVPETLFLYIWCYLVIAQLQTRAVPLNSDDSTTFLSCNVPVRDGSFQQIQATGLYRLLLNKFCRI